MKKINVNDAIYTCARVQLFNSYLPRYIISGMNPQWKAVLLYFKTVCMRFFVSGFICAIRCQEKSMLKFNMASLPMGHRETKTLDIS